MSAGGAAGAARPLETTYRALLRLYPTEFRRRHAGEMLQSLRERLTDPRHRGSLAVRWRLTALLAEDLLRSIPREHLLAWRRRSEYDPASELRRTRAGRQGHGQVPEPSKSPRSRMRMDSLLQDLRFAVRTLARRPAFSLIVIVTLALGIGATTTIFSVLDGVVIRALPYPDSERLVLVGSESELFSSFGPVSPFAFREWQSSNDVFESMAASSRQNLDLTGRGEPQRLQGAAVSPELFQVLGTAPLIGRGLMAEDNVPGAPRVVVISYGLWQRSWGGEDSVVGSTVTLSGGPWTIVGVLPGDFLPVEAINHREVEVWFPLAASEIDLNDRGNFLLRVVAKLQPGVSIETARQAMAALAWALENEDHGSSEDMSLAGSLSGPSGVSRAAAGEVGFGAAPASGGEDSSEQAEQLGNGPVTVTEAIVAEAPVASTERPAMRLDDTAAPEAEHAAPRSRMFGGGGDRGAGNAEQALGAADGGRPGNVVAPAGGRRSSSAPQRLAVSIGGDNVQVLEEPTIRVAVVSLKERTIGDSSGTLVTLAGAVVFLLLIACANVANLLLARSGDRTREVAVRAALGAGRRRIVRQLLTESVLLSLAGGLAGALLAVVGVSVFLGFNPGDLPRLQQVVVDMRVLGFTFAGSVLTGLLFGTVPALNLARGDVGEMLKEGGHATQGRARARFRGLLVVAETGLALVLLVGAGLMINSFVRLTSVDPGFEPDNLVTMRVEVGEGYPTPAERTEFVRALTERIAAIPGVETVGMTSLMPFTGLYTMSSLEVEDPLERADSGVDWVGMHQINGDYFGSMRMRFVTGRPLTEAEMLDGAGAVVVNETFARQFWGDTTVIGQRLRLGNAEDGAPWRTVVGVIADIKQFSLSGPTRPDLYMPYEGSAGGNRVHVAARLGVDVTSVGAAMREAVWALDASLPVDGLLSMRELISGSVDEPRFYAALLGTFAAVALVLAAVGIYGTVAYTVGQRMRELGIRRALGAGAPDLLVLVTRQGLALVLAGVVLGAIGAYWLSSFVSGFLYDVVPTDLPTFAVVAAVLAISGALACAIPARRATRVDPMLALRSE